MHENGPLNTGHSNPNPDPDLNPHLHPYPMQRPSVAARNPIKKPLKNKNSNLQ